MTAPQCIRIGVQEDIFVLAIFFISLNIQGFSKVRFNLIGIALVRFPDPLGNLTRSAYALSLTPCVLTKRININCCLKLLPWQNSVCEWHLWLLWREKLCKQWDFPMSSGCLLHQRLIFTEAQQIQTPDIQLNVDNCLEEKWKMLSIVLKDSVTLCALDACTSHVWRSYLHRSRDRCKEKNITTPTKFEAAVYTKST